MSKTLVIAEKPSVGRDLAATLPGTFKQSKDKTHLADGDYVITWAVGHLVGLAEPDQYDEKLKKWRFADLPIVPKKFKLIPNDDKAKKQLNAVHKLMKAEDVELIVNACDAGREGELIFAYLYETSGVKKPVKRLWLNSMTKAAIREAFEHLRDGDEMRLLEEAARSRSEADWLVGMNATRAASIRLRAAFDGAVSLGRVQTPTLALVVAARARDPRLRPRAVLARRGEVRRDGRAPLQRPLPRRQADQGGRGQDDRRRDDGAAGHDHQARAEGGARGAAAPLRPHLAPAAREHALRLLRAPHPRRGAEALRGAQGDHVPTNELALPHLRHDRRDQADRRARRPPRALRTGGVVRHPPGEAPARAASSTTSGSRTTTRSSRPAPTTT